MQAAVYRKHRSLFLLQNIGHVMKKRKLKIKLLKTVSAFYQANVRVYAEIKTTIHLLMRIIIFLPGLSLPPHPADSDEGDFCKQKDNLPFFFLCGALFVPQQARKQCACIQECNS